MSLGGGGGGDAPSTTTTISKSEPPEYVKPYSVELMNRAGELSNADYQAYPGERIAPFTDQHMGGMQMMQDRAMYGDPMMDQAKSHLWNTMEGNYFGPGMDGNPFLGMTTGQQYNPYIGQHSGRAKNNYIGSYSAPAGNDYIGQNTSVGQNQFLGLENPYLENQIDKVQSDMKENYDMSVAPYLDQQERRSGSFGNSGLQEMRGKSLSELNKNLGQAASDIRYGDYQNQLGLAESDVSRQAQYGNADLTRNSQLAQGLNQFNASLGSQELGRNAQLNQALNQFNATLGNNDLARNSQLFQNMGQFNATLGQGDLNRNMLGYENMSQRNQGAWQAERDQQMRAAALAPQYDTQYQDAMRMMGIGDVLRDYNQSQLNYGYDTWRQGQNWPYQQLDTLANAIRTSMGGGGSMVTSSPDAYSSNSTMGMLGGGMLGYGLAQDSGISPLLGAAGGGLLGGFI